MIFKHTNYMKRLTAFLLCCFTAATIYAQAPTIKVLSESAVNVKYDGKAPAGQPTKWKTSKMQVEYNAKNGQITVKNKKGKVVMQTKGVPQASSRGKSLTLLSPADEYLYGTGQFQDGNLNVRGLTRRLTQVNTQISIPFILSNKGYGLLWNNTGMTDFNPADNVIVLKEDKGDDQKGEVVNVTSTTGNRQERRMYQSFVGTISIAQDGDYALLLDVGQSMARKHYLAIDGKPVVDINNTWLPPTVAQKVSLKAGSHSIEVRGVRGDKPSIYWRQADNTTTFRSPLGDVDFTVFVGSADEVIAEYRHQTGEVPLLPEWALGYIHCRERFHSQDEILETVREFKRRNIPISMIVQDWQYWGKYGWNAMRFDEDHYPDPKKMIDELHDMGVRFMLSVWAKVDVNSELGKEFTAKGYYIKNTDWIDVFNQEAADAYCKAQRERLASLGIDGWWQDATEPENDDLKGRMVNNGTLSGDVVRNMFAYKVNENVYKSLKEYNLSRGIQDNPFILTRSASQGIQKFGVAVWSGDVGNDWETLHRQIVAGLGLVSTGLPWWTYDAGGFFRPGNQYTDAAYQECMIRWIQTSVFLPLMRVHGYQSNTEPWRYSRETEELFADAIRLRYQMMPYIKKIARRVSTEGYTMMRPLVFDFADDPEALKQDNEYMFGPSLLICPVIKPMSEAQTMEVYLPKSEGGWYDFYTGKRYDGGQTVTVTLTMDHIPFFVRQSERDEFPLRLRG